MDTVILIKLKGENIYLGGDNIGDSSTLYRLCHILINLFLKTGVSMDAFEFLSKNLYEIDGSNVQDLECVIDKENQTLQFEDLKINKITEDNNDLCHFNYENIDALQRKTFTFKDYIDFYKLIRKSLKDGKCIINNTYLVRF